MSSLTIQLPESILRELERCAVPEVVSVDQLMASAATEKLSALLDVEHLRQRATRGNRERFLRFLESSPDEAPVDGDERG